MAPESIQYRILQRSAGQRSFLAQQFLEFVCLVFIFQLLVLEDGTAKVVGLIGEHCRWLYVFEESLGLSQHCCAACKMPDENVLRHARGLLLVICVLTMEQELQQVDYIATKQRNTQTNKSRVVRVYLGGCM